MKVLSPSLFVALYGSFQPHPWIVIDEMEEDAYSLFFHRAQMMGWSQSSTQARARTLWEMNDASFDPRTSASTGLSRIAWFQVGIDEQEVSGSVLPLQPLLACATDSVRRVGDMELEGVQLLVPLQAAGTPAQLSSVPNWFNVCDPDSRTRMRVTLDSGADPVVPQVADELSELVTRLARQPFAVESFTGKTHVHLEPEVTDGFWMGEGRHPLTFDIVAPDWTTDSIAWTANLLTESCRRVGVATSVLLNVARG